MFFLRFFTCKGCTKKNQSGHIIVNNSYNFPYFSTKIAGGMAKNMRKHQKLFGNDILHHHGEIHGLPRKIGSRNLPARYIW